MKLDDWMASLFNLPCIAILILGSIGLNTNRVAAEQHQLLEQLQSKSSIGYLQTGKNELWETESNSADVVEFKKIHNGLEILGNRLIVYLDEDGGIKRIEDDSTENMTVGKKQPLISADLAINVAHSSINKLEVVGSSSHLVWFRKADQGILAWQIELELAPSGGPCSATHMLITIDANNGQLLSQSQRGGNMPEIDSKTGIKIVPCKPPIVINDTAGTAQAQNFGAAFPAVCNPTNGGCSGTLIAPNVVLGARHCGDSAGDLVRFGHDRDNPDFTTTVQSVTLPGGGNPGTDITNGGDVAIIVLNANVPVGVATPARLIPDTASLIGTTGTCVGYGGQGVGSTGDVGISGFRWAGENVIDAFGQPVFLGGANIFTADFDDGSAAANVNPGSSANPLAFEAMVAPGDSGGPLLVEMNGEFFVVGVGSFIADIAGIGNGNLSTFGFNGYWTGAAEFREQIEAVGGEFFESGTLPGDVNCDEVVNLLDVEPFVDLLTSGGFSPKGDINNDGVINLLDVGPFVDLLAGE